jgi:AcrR family transcriptional regulator
MVLKTNFTPEPRKRGRPPRSQEDASVAIRKAALNAFARSGFQGASIIDIAKIAGVAKPLVHYHFASKDALWQAAVEGAVATLSAELVDFQKTLGSLDPDESLRRVARQLVLFASQHPQLVRIVVDETGKGGARADWLHANFLVPGYLLGKSLLDGVSNGGSSPAKPLPAEHVVPIILGVMNFAFLDAEVIRKAYGVDVHSVAYVERHGEFLYHLIRPVLLQP